MTFDDLLARLQEFDLLLDTDPKFPSVTGLVVGADVRGSWWAHPQAKKMYRLACRLRAHPDVLLLKLISGKVTLVNRPLWPAIYAIATAREAWQTAGLSREATALLKKADKEGTVSSSGDAVRELESRLLVYAASVHTERGFHVKQMQSWRTWAESAHLGDVDLSPAEGKAQLEKVVARLNKQFSASGTLPWQKRRPRRDAATHR